MSKTSLRTASGLDLRPRVVDGRVEYVATSFVGGRRLESVGSSEAEALRRHIARVRGSLEMNRA